MSQHFDEHTLAGMIDRCLEEGRDLNEWEEQFLESVREQLKRDGQLSMRQEEIVDKIYTNNVP